MTQADGAKVASGPEADDDYGVERGEGQAERHGGDLDRAIAQYGAGDWIDLSTGINPLPYPTADLPAEIWSRLPTAAALADLAATAQQAYQTTGKIVSLAGASAAIQMIPYLMTPGRASIVAPTYSGHAAALQAAGWSVDLVPDLTALSGATLAVVVNPNNPDGRCWSIDALQDVANRVGLLVVDESFADATPAQSLAPHVTPDSHNLIVLRSFGKFYGLAGLRLGFAISGAALAQRLQKLAGPWPVSGPAITLGQRALTDAAWKAATVDRLQQDALRLDEATRRAGWTAVGGTVLFRTCRVPDVALTQDHLARHYIWSRIFPNRPGWLRLGLPYGEAAWRRLMAALAGKGE